MKHIRKHSRNIILALAALAALISLNSSDSPSLWGVPITPALLAEQGKLDLFYSGDPYTPEKDWEQSWMLWLPGRAKPNSRSGYLSLNKKHNPGEGTVSFSIRQIISEDNSWMHATWAEIEAGGNPWNTPVNWNRSTAFYTSQRQGRKEIEEIRSYKEDSLDAFSPDRKENLVASFTLMDVIQQMHAGNIKALNFTLLDELDKKKGNHSIRFLEDTRIYFAGKQQDVRCYLSVGEGTLPCKYYVGREGWVLLAISGMRTYILDQGQEHAYDETIERPVTEIPGTIATERSVSESKKPNILFITTDQQTWNTLSANGNPYLHTPNLDRIALKGVSFRQSYSPNPVCSPTRACWLTGITSAENGVIYNGLPILDGLQTAAQVLSEQGYETVFSGKLHVGIPDSYGQQIPGFSKVLCEGIGGKGTLGDQVVSSVCQGYLQNRDKSKPFYLAVNFLQPHDVCNWISRQSKINRDTPYLDLIREELPRLPANFCALPEEPGKMKIARKTWSKETWRYYLWSYYRMVEEVDAEIGRVLDALDESGEAANTVIIFNSDHGEGAAHHQSVLKDFAYDESSRVPFIISFPRELQQGIMDEEHLVSGLDVVPTLCDFAGADLPKNGRGLSVRQIAGGGKADWREFLVTELNRDQGRMIRTRDHKLVAFRDDPDLLFFDMKNDPGETTNLANDSACSDLIDKHILMLENWESGLNYAPNIKELFTVTRRKSYP